MDKQFYINMHLVDNIFLPYYSIQLNDKVISIKKELAKRLSNYLTMKIYDEFSLTIKAYTNSSLENFYEILENHFKDIENDTYLKNVTKTKKDYYELKKINSELALKKFLPIPDENPKGRLIHLLPNYNAFTSLIARTQIHNSNFLGSVDINIIHDEQKQFDIIFENALKLIKNTDTDDILKSTSIPGKAKYNISQNISLTFVDSKTEICVQVSDIISGFVMRYCIDRDKRNISKIKIVEPSIKKLSSPYFDSVGINFVVPIP